MPLLGLCGEIGERLGVGHVKLVEEEEGVMTNKLGQIGFHLLLGSERTDFELLVKLSLEGKALHHAPGLLEGLPGGPGDGGLVLHRHYVPSQ